jgi:hypothetical protein
MIRTVDGNCRVNGTPSLGPRDGLCRRRGGSAHPGRAAPAGQPEHHQHHASGQARQSPQLIAQATLAYLPSKAIDDGARPVDQSPSARFIQRP